MLLHVFSSEEAGKRWAISAFMARTPSCALFETPLKTPTTKLYKKRALCNSNPFEPVSASAPPYTLCNNMELASTSDTTWMDNVFYGWIDTTWDALLVLEAARRGIVPRVTRRFHDIEKRNMIRSGAVIVFTEEESSVKRWTDPYLWSASRMLGNFMVRV